MVVSRREGSISSNIRAIIEQLNLNPVERRRLIDRTKQDAGAPRCMEPAARISIGVYGCKERPVGYEMPVRRAPDRPRPRQETGQRKILAPIKREGEEHALEAEQDKRGFGSMRSMRKIEDRPRPEKRRAIPRANRERSTDHQIPNSPLHELHECVALSGRVAKTQDKGMEDRSRQRIVVPPKEAAPQRIEEEVSKSAADRVVAKEDLPELESASLSHTAAHHRISVRPKNRRPPRRSGSAATPTITTIAEDSSIRSTVNSSDTESKSAASIGRKSSARSSSDILDELKCKKPPLSPDSLDAVEASDEQRTAVEIRRKSSTRRAEMFDELESKLPRRRSSSSKSPDSLEGNGWLSKSSEGFEKLMEGEARQQPRRLSISKSSERVSKSSDSLEAIEALASDESTIERRRSSFGHHRSRNMSKSSESFEQIEAEKRSSVPDINLSRRRLSKSISKSSEDFERVEMSGSKEEGGGKRCSRRSSSKRVSSESSDNLESGEDRLVEGRRMRRAPRRIPSTSYVVDIVDDGRHVDEEERRPIVVRKACRLQKSSESSELGSTDTLDSERRNKSSESTETLDSLERDLEIQERKGGQEDVADTVADRREKNDLWTNRSLMMSHSDQMSADSSIEDSKPLISPEKFYWRQSSESKENIDIHQLLAITIVTRMADNGNNQRSSVIYPKKKQQIATSQPTSPVAKQEDNKMIFDNLLVSKNDEDLQNMLNGNISEVSTDTKSFKEKLIMFEKLGK
ncbi:uncharacterized protein LOC100872435 isoform X3 [Apis florea]|uniref:uncharacterized protein LOC100872435 isoform X3 n=1 Tax=Apis florea TaxID=7463 RepID=UPI0012FE9139|nr:uncharacterized protein LOC100872435 isoform X3 [Apis florea]